jgi:hypothetical protein
LGATPDEETLGGRGTIEGVTLEEAAREGTVGNGETTSEQATKKER